MKKISILSILIVAAVVVSGCNKFLEKEPDNRTQIDSQEKIALLLTSAYPHSNYAPMVSAMMDYVSDKGPGSFTVHPTNTDPFFWRDPTDIQQDSPNHFWTNCYSAIAAANQALASIAEMPNPSICDPQKGEALLCRAFAHFMLVSLYSRFYDPATAATEMGIPYVDEVETVVIKQYDRKTVAYVYERIEQDLVAGLELVGTDDVYKAPKFHFTKAAANAFAARFYLYKRDWAKVITHTNQVAPVPSLFIHETEDGRNVAAADAAVAYATNNFQPWLTTYTTYSSSTSIKIDYSKADATGSNLLLIETSSRQSRNANSWRYATKKTDTDATVSAANATGGSWAYRTFYSGDSYYVPKHNEFFYYTTATTGLIYTIFPHFRVEELFLNRAEAYAMLGNEQAALDNLNVFCRLRIKSYDEKANMLTSEKLISFYGEGLTSDDFFLNQYDAFGAKSWSVAKKALITTILDYRKNEFMWEGLRWFDILRYKIPVTHTTFDNQTNTLYPGDDRQMIQLPEEVTLSGVPLNPRTNILSPLW